MLLFTLLCFYLVSPSSLGVYCQWQEGNNCWNIPQAHAKNKVSPTLEKVVMGGEENEKTISFEEEKRRKAQEIVSEKAIEQREFLKQSEAEQKLEIERQKEYQARLLEEWKVIVAEYEAERQKKLMEK